MNYSNNDDGVPENETDGNENFGFSDNEIDSKPAEIGASIILEHSRTSSDIQNTPEGGGHSPKSQRPRSQPQLSTIERPDSKVNKKQQPKDVHNLQDVGARGSIARYRKQIQDVSRQRRHHNNSNVTKDSKSNLVSEAAIAKDSKEEVVMDVEKGSTSDHIVMKDNATPEDMNDGNMDTVEKLAIGNESTIESEHIHETDAKPLTAEAHRITKKDPLTSSSIPKSKQLKKKEVPISTRRRSGSPRVIHSANSEPESIPPNDAVPKKSSDGNKINSAETTPNVVPPPTKKDNNRSAKTKPNNTAAKSSNSSRPKSKENKRHKNTVDPSDSHPIKSSLKSMTSESFSTSGGDLGEKSRGSVTFEDKDGEEQKQRDSSGKDAKAQSKSTKGKAKVSKTIVQRETVAEEKENDDDGYENEKYDEDGYDDDTYENEKYDDSKEDESPHKSGEGTADNYEDDVRDTPPSAMMIEFGALSVLTAASARPDLRVASESKALPSEVVTHSEHTESGHAVAGHPPDGVKTHQDYEHKGGSKFEEPSPLHHEQMQSISAEAPNVMANESVRADSTDETNEDYDEGFEADDASPPKKGSDLTPEESSKLVASADQKHLHSLSHEDDKKISSHNHPTPVHADVQSQGTEEDDCEYNEDYEKESLSSLTGAAPSHALHMDHGDNPNHNSNTQSQPSSTHQNETVPDGQDSKYVSSNQYEEDEYEEEFDNELNSLLENNESKHNNLVNSNKKKSSASLAGDNYDDEDFDD